MAALNITMKPSFMSQLMLLPPKNVKQITTKLQTLADNPHPDAKVKKQLKYLDGKLHRLRVGDYRVFYTFDDAYVSLLAVDKRDEKTYAGDLEGEDLGGPASIVNIEPLKVPLKPPVAWADIIDQKKKRPAKTPLARKIDAGLLDALSIPNEHHATLVELTTEDDLLNCDSVPTQYLNRVLDAVVAASIEQIARQPEYVANDADDLVKYRNGEIEGFLLRLDPDQKKFVEWGMKASGPTLLKGGPGTGKSIIALYRAQAMIRALKASGVEKPRLLFTTYTNSLVSYSKSLLKSLLRDEADCVIVRTVDSVMREVADVSSDWAAPTSKELREILKSSLESVVFEGNSLRQSAQRLTLEKLGTHYLLEEILDVIEARGLGSLDDYLAAKRPGREVTLNKTQRAAVWRASEAFRAKLKAQGRVTWHQVRSMAAQQAMKSKGKYDGVIIDEAQDLSPTALRALTALAKSPNRLFLTADANQSIYGAGFRWQDVHEDLKFTGRTGTLKANYRSTQEIGEAACSYLASGELDDEKTSQSFVKSGPVPAVRSVAKADDEIALLETFIRFASKELRMGVGACAVLVPTKIAGERICASLKLRQIGVEFMVKKDIDLHSKSVKIITLQSAKGLEFPCVAIAGLDGEYLHSLDRESDDETTENHKRERRVMFVGMTRAMHSLMVLVPAKRESPLLKGFDRSVWNVGADLP